MKNGNSVLDRVYSMTGDPDEARDVYADWAESYDEDTLDRFGYVGPRLVAEKLKEYADPDATILDAGCGTGLAGEELDRAGFSTFDGIDLSEEMLAVAEAKKIYRKLTPADMTGPLDLADNSYDAVVCAGVFTSGHIGPDGFDELVRVVRSGGVIVATVHENVWKDGYSEHLTELARRDLIRVKETAEADYHRNAGYRCRMCVLEVI